MTNKAPSRGTGAKAVGAKAKQIQDLLDKWQPKLGLQKWVINIHINNKYDPEEEGCQADITEDLRYFEADLNIWKRFWEDKPWKQELTIVHELCHLLLCQLHNHLAPSGDEEVERTTQSLAMLLYRNLK